MGVPFWQKPVFWAIFLLTLTAILIPLSLYVFKDAIIAILPVNLIGKIQSIKPGSCLILEQKYCSQAEVIDWANSKGQKFKIIGFKNIPTGTPLFPPVNAGEITKAKLPERGNFKGFQATISDPNEPNVWYIVSGDITFPDMNNATKKEGEAFGSVGNTGITNAGGYKLLVYVLRRVGQETTSDNDQLEGIFAKTKL